MPRKHMGTIQRTFEQYRSDIDRALAGHLPRRLSRHYLERALGVATRTVDVTALEGTLAEPVWNLLDRGGKRWRPVLFFLVVRILGENPRRFSDVAAMLELIHNGTLIVDDVEDGSALRRGQPSIHRMFGVDVAVNAGNALYVLPLVHLLRQRSWSADQRSAVLAATLEDLARLHIGQAMDIAWHRGQIPGREVSERQYVSMCAYKTGSLARLAATLGAILGGATLRQRRALEQFGENLGITFQIQDDILNITESELSRQKGRGEDISEGKRSLPVIYALHHTSRVRRARLLEILAMHTAHQRLRDEAITIIAESGALTYARRTATQLMERSRAQMERAFSSTPGRHALFLFTELLMERTV